MAMQVGHSQTLPQLGKDPIEKIVAAMTAEEKVSLLVGTGMPGFGGQSAVVGSTQNIVPGAAGTTFPIERLGIPAIVVADGPAGLRISPTREGNEATYYCTAFPVATLLASTWNTALVKNVGNAMGDEVKEYGCDVLLAPALNIHRSPLCGRNFEYYSEDPYLTGRIATAMVNGIQSNGVGTSIKHFAVNNQETNRTGTDARLTPRALREIYLRGFEMVVKEASPWTVMSSYNKINGEYASESRDLLTTILRDEWGFSGLVMTDWFGGKNAPAQIHAGNDLLMPGRTDQKEALLKALEDGSLSIDDVDTDVTRVLRLILQAPRFAQYAYSDKPDLKAHAEVTRASASEGMVLLKNTNNALPLAPGIKKIAAYGTTSYDFIAGGTGSGDVNEAYTVSLVEGLENAGYTMDAEVKALYEKYSTEEKAKQPKDTSPAAAFFNHPRIPEFVPDAAGLAAKAKEADIAFVTIGRSSGEFQDRKIEGDFNLTENERALIQSVSDAFHKEGKKVVVILNIASTKNFPDASGIDLKEMSAGFMGGGPEHTDRKNIDYTNYEEGIYVGYRYFDTFGVPVSYPFGYGQSYTTFNYSSLKVFMGDTDYSISCTITNNGPVAGKEVVQLYISAPGKSMDKPAKELRGFVKTQLLQPGESREIIFKVKDTDLASQIGSSADDIRLRDSFNVKGRVTEKVHAVLLPGERIDLLKR